MSLENILHEVRELKLLYQQSNSAPQAAEPAVLGSHSCSICGSPWHPTACCSTYHGEAYDFYQPRPQYPDYYPMAQQGQEFQGYYPMIQQRPQFQDYYPMEYHNDWSAHQNFNWEDREEKNSSYDHPSMPPSSSNATNESTGFGSELYTYLAEMRESRKEHKEFMEQMKQILDSINFSGNSSHGSSLVDQVQVEEPSFADPNVQSEVPMSNVLHDTPKPLVPWMIWNSKSEDESESEPLPESAPFDAKSEKSDDDKWEQTSSTCKGGTEGSFASDFPMFVHDDNPSSSLIPEPESFLAVPTEFFLDKLQSLQAQYTLEHDVMMEQATILLADSFACQHNALEFDLFKESPLLAQELALSIPSLSYLEDFPAAELDVQMLESEVKSAKLEPYTLEPHMDLHLDFPAADLDDFDGYLDPFSVTTESVQISEDPEITPAAINTELGLFCASNSLEIDHTSSVFPAITSATQTEFIFKVAHPLETEPAPFIHPDLSSCWYSHFSDFDGAIIKKAAPQDYIQAFLHLLQLLKIDSRWIHLVKYLPTHLRILREWCKTKEFQGSQHGVQLEDDHHSKIFRSLTDDELEEHMDKTPTTEFFCNNLLWRNFPGSMKPP